VDGATAAMCPAYSGGGGVMTATRGDRDVMRPGPGPVMMGAWTRHNTLMSSDTADQSTSRSNSTYHCQWRRQDFVTGGK